MTKLKTAAAALMFVLSSVVPFHATAQANTVDGVMTICTDVINLQYENDRRRDTQCIGAVTEYMKVIGAPSASADPLITELILRLLELYREDDNCTIAETELPIAIKIAAESVLDEDLKVEYMDLWDQIMSCDFSAGSAINPDPAPASES